MPPKAAFALYVIACFEACEGLESNATVPINMMDKAKFASMAASNMLAKCTITVRQKLIV